MGTKKSARFMTAPILCSFLLMSASLQVTKAGDRSAAANWVLPLSSPDETSRRLLGTRRPTISPPAPTSRPVVSPISPVPVPPPPPPAPTSRPVVSPITPIPVPPPPPCY